MKPKAWEIIIAAVILILAYILIFHVNWSLIGGQEQYEAPIGATDEYIMEDAYKKTDATACESLSTEQGRLDCLEKVEIKESLDESIKVEKSKTSESTGTTDRKYFGLAEVKNDPSYCQKIIDASIKQECLENFN